MGGKTRVSIRLAATLWAALLCCALWPAASVRAADVSSGYQDAVKDFNTLRKDPASGGRRDLWKALEARLAALAKAAGKDVLAAKILYYQAWTNAELGARSYLDADYAAAADLYKRMADAFPKHAWADDALLRRADILKGPLKKPDEAKADLELLLRRHPKGDMAARAKIMLAELSASGASEAQAAKAGPAAFEKKTGPPPATSAKPAVLTRAAVAQSSTGGRLTLSLDRETAYRYQLLEQKRSGGDTVKLLYIDLDNTRTGQGVPSEKRFDKGAVSRLRAGYFSPETVRVVLELADVRQYEIHAEADPFRIVLDLTAGSAKDGGAPQYRAEASKPEASPAAKSAGWLGNVFRSQDAPDQGPAPGKSKSGRIAATEPAKASRPLRPSAEAKKRVGNLIEQLGLSVRTIMIDPGHGGKDPGAQGLYGITEKDVNLRFAKLLGEALRKKGFNVLYTRSTDVFIPLETRTEMANTKGADLFVSIHCNSHGNADSQGLETYSLNLANSREAVRVAARENAVSQKKVSDLQAILTDLMLSAKTSESKDLAKLVQKRALTGLRGNWRTRDRGPHEAPFFVLIGANMPAVLVELGYITNPDEAKHLNSDAYQQALAQGMADGITAYKKRIERYANL